jgi:uncharacterized cupin superfamily protein
MLTSALLRPLRIDPDALDLIPLALDPEDFQSPLPVQHYYLIFEDEAIGLAVGIWDTTTMQEAFGPYPGDEFITVLDGSFSIVDGLGGAVTGHSGQSATFRNAIPVSWKQEGYLRKIYLTLHDPLGQTPEIASAEGGVRILDPLRSVTGTPAPDGIVEEVVFRNDAGTMTVSHRAYPARSLPVAVTGAHDLCRVLTGEMTLTDETGTVHRFGPDAHVFLPQGTRCARATVAGTIALHVEVSA